MNERSPINSPLNSPPTIRDEINSPATIKDETQSRTQPSDSRVPQQNNSVPQQNNSVPQQDNQNNSVPQQDNKEVKQATTSLLREAKANAKKFIEMLYEGRDGKGSNEEILDFMFNFQYTEHPVFDVNYRCVSFTDMEIDGMTPLIMTVVSGYLHFGQILINKGAECRDLYNYILNSEPDDYPQYNLILFKRALKLHQFREMIDIKELVKLNKFNLVCAAIADNIPCNVLADLNSLDNQCTAIIKKVAQIKELAAANKLDEKETAELRTIQRHVTGRVRYRLKDDALHTLFGQKRNFTMVGSVVPINDEIERELLNGIKNENYLVELFKLKNCLGSVSEEVARKGNFYQCESRFP